MDVISLAVTVGGVADELIKKAHAAHKKANQQGDVLNELIEECKSTRGCVEDTHSVVKRLNLDESKQKTLKPIQERLKRMKDIEKELCNELTKLNLALPPSNVERILAQRKTDKSMKPIQKQRQKLERERICLDGDINRLNLILSHGADNSEEEEGTTAEEEMLHDESKSPEPSSQSPQERIINSVAGLRYESVKQQLEKEENLCNVMRDDRTLIDIAICYGQPTDPRLERLITVLQKYGTKFTLQDHPEQNEKWEKVSRRSRSAAPSP